jgi:hypothetical protein
VANRSKKPSRLTRELEEMGRALHRLGALSDDEYAKFRLRNRAPDKMDRAGAGKRTTG